MPGNVLTPDVIRRAKEIMLKPERVFLMSERERDLQMLRRWWFKHEQRREALYRRGALARARKPRKVQH